MIKAAHLSTGPDNRPLVLFRSHDMGRARRYRPSRTNVRRFNNAVRRLVDQDKARLWPCLTGAIGYYVERLACSP